MLIKKTTIGLLSLLFILGILVACGQEKSEPAPVKTVTVSKSQDESTKNVSAESGEILYEANCSVCHNIDGRGIEGIGKNLVDGEFILETSDDDLLSFVKVGRSTDDPKNTSGIAMLPKGGNPSLTDQEIKNIIAYLRTLQ